MNEYKFDYIGKHIRRVRENQNISRDELAERVFVSSETIRRIEKGVTDPNVSTLFPVCNELGIDVRSLFLEDNNLLDERLIFIYSHIDYTLSNFEYQNIPNLIDMSLDLMSSRLSDYDYKRLVSAIFFLNGIQLSKLEQNYIESEEYLINAIKFIHTNFSYDNFDKLDYNSQDKRILATIASNLAFKEEKKLAIHILEYLYNRSTALEEKYFFLYKLTLQYAQNNQLIKAKETSEVLLANARKTMNVRYIVLALYIQSMISYRLKEKEADVIINSTKSYLSLLPNTNFSSTILSSLNKLQ